MRFKSIKEAALSFVFAALYVVAVVALAPISFTVFQVRVGDALLPLAIMFGWPSVMGLTVGAAVANIFGGLGPVDIIGGSLANFLATWLGWKVSRRGFRNGWILALTLQVMLVTAIVGSYLSLLLSIPVAFSILGVFIGSVIAIGILGSLLLAALSRPVITRTLQALGVKVYLKER
ncbi:MAG: QueT transporter family protein [Candidatus Bathyarchaeia archaeon]